MTRGSEAMTWRGATSFGTGMTRGSEAMTWRDDVDRKKGNSESGVEEGIRNRSARESKYFGGSILGLGCRGEAFLGSVFMKRTLMDRELGGTVLEPCWNGPVLEPEVGGVGTGGGRCWNRRWAVLEPEVGGVGPG
jgi:hypothetical protein